jgi:hypothetical protein
MGAAAELRERFRQSWDLLATRLKDEHADRVTASGWTVKEMLAHVAFWMETVPPFVTGMWRGDASAFDVTFPSGFHPDGEWPSADVHNAREAAWARDRSHGDVRRRLDTAASRLARFLETVTDDEVAEHRTYFAEAHDHLDEHRRELEARADDRDTAAVVRRALHPLVDQLRFTRSEWLRGLDGLTEDEAAQHFGPNPMNSIGWIVGHLAWQEQRYLLDRSQGLVLFPRIKEEFAFGAPMSTPSLAAMLDAWRTITAAADPLLDRLTTTDLETELPLDGKPVGQSLGSAIRRLTYHYWFHIGEIQSIRQMMGHKDLPTYVGAIEQEAPYRREG